MYKLAVAVVARAAAATAYIAMWAVDVAYKVWRAPSDIEH